MRAVGPAELSLKTIAAMLDIGVRALDRRFRSQTGLSLAEWRREVRLIESVRLLFAGVPVDEIAVRVGYSSRWTFATAFRHRFAFTPFQYRRMYGPGNQV